MNAPALAIVNNAPEIRKFAVPDLSMHGNWVIPRMLEAFPHMDERAALTFLIQTNYANDHLLLFSDEGIALAQVITGSPLDPATVVWERFVWIKDREDADMQKHAAEFYSHIYQWAKGLSAVAIMVEESSDVPHDLIKDKIGRVFKLERQFVRV